MMAQIWSRSASAEVSQQHAEIEQEIQYMLKFVYWFMFVCWIFLHWLYHIDTKGPLLGGGHDALPHFSCGPKLGSAFEHLLILHHSWWKKDVIKRKIPIRPAFASWNFPPHCNIGFNTEVTVMARPQAQSNIQFKKKSVCVNLFAKRFLELQDVRNLVHWDL